MLNRLSALAAELRVQVQDLEERSPISGNATFSGYVYLDDGTGPDIEKQQRMKRFVSQDGTKGRKRRKVRSD
jgi:hypothetical protein